MAGTKIAMACDHAGLPLKRLLMEDLEGRGFTVLDLGTHDEQSVDYPDFADAMARALADGSVDRGVLVCGSGVGIAMAANRHAHVRAAVAWDVSSARLARAHNDANVLALGARLVGPVTAKDCLGAFLDTRFEGGRHVARVAKLSRQRQTA